MGDSDATTDPVRMWWWSEPGLGNFGDVLSPRIVRQLVRREINKAKEGPRLLGIGSILKWAKEGDQVWGSGHAHAKHAVPTAAEILCVRGPVTAWMLRGQGVSVPECFGDPALLLPLLYRQELVGPRFSVGVIPHYIDAKTPAVRELDGREDVCVIDICAPVETVVDQICDCNVIVSSSLHGIIAAEAYGVAAVWAEFSDQVVGGGMKFRDYYASTERMAEALDARVHLDLDGIAGRATPGIEPAVLAARQWDLMETFPFDVDWDEALARDPKRRGAEGWTEPATPWTGWHGGRA